MRKLLLGVETEKINPNVVLFSRDAGVFTCPSSPHIGPKQLHSPLPLLHKTAHGVEKHESLAEMVACHCKHKHEGVNTRL